MRATLVSSSRDRAAIGLCLGATLVFLTLGLTHVKGGDDDKKSVIGDIMKKTHKGDNSLVKHVIAGKATPDEISTLLADYKILVEQDPPKGSKESWKEKTGKLITTLSAVQTGDKSAIPAFKKAVSCKVCHEVHKED